MMRSEQADTPSLREAPGVSTPCCSTCTIHTYITAHTYTHTRVTCKIHAHAHDTTVYYDPVQLTNSIHKGTDINEMHVYWRNSAPIVQGLVYDINHFD